MYVLSKEIWDSSVIRKSHHLEPLVKKERDSILKNLPFNRTADWSSLIKDCVDFVIEFAHNTIYRFAEEKGFVRQIR